MAAVSDGVDQYNGMEKELNRLATFPAGWPHTDKGYPTRLAVIGFYWKVHELVCFFCHVTVPHWNSYEDVDQKHRPDCSTSREAVNVAFRSSSDLEADSLPVPFRWLLASDRNRVQPLEIQSNIFDEASAAEVQSGGGFPDARHPEYGSLESRLESYNKWPPNYYVTPAQLAAAGFYYLGHGDSVRCFYCDGGLLNWAHGDDPLTEHRRWFSNCKFLKQLSKQDEKEPAEEKTKCSVLETGQDFTTSAALSEAVLDHMEVEQASNDVEHTNANSMPHTAASSVREKSAEEKAASMPALEERGQSKDEVTKKKKVPTATLR